MMLGYLLARAGVPVTVFEKHADFFRDFRGDTIHPSTLELMRELGLLDRLLTIPHSKINQLSATVGGEVFHMADFSHLPVTCQYIALMPQWDFLNFLAAEAAKFPAFTLRMSSEVTGLVTEEGRVTGVKVQTPQGSEQVAAGLVVGCDGRHAITREAAHLGVVEEGVPIDVLWMRLPREADDPENTLGYINYGRALILINRDSYFQCGYIIGKGQFAEVQAAGLAAFQEKLERIAPFLRERTGTIDSWEKVKLLTVQINHLERWWAPGLLCIGDCAHAMSPVGGIGINIALQDAVAAANLLAVPLREERLRDADLRGVQTHRERPVRRTQWIQARAHKVMDRVLRSPGPIRPPLLLRMATHTPWFQRMVGRFVGMGLQPEHVKTGEIRQ